MTTLEQAIREDLKHWRQIIKKYQTPSTPKAILQISNTFLPFIGLWVLMYFSLGWSYWITIALALVNAFFLSRIFIIQHDCGHNSFLKSKRWNEIVGFVCSFFSTIPFRYWARVHNVHHGHSGQLEPDMRDIGDIDYLTVREYQSLSRWGRFRYRLFRSPLVMFVIVPAVYLAFPMRYPTIRVGGVKRVHLSLLRNNLWLVAVYVSLGFLIGWKHFLSVQIPIVLFFMIIAFWFFYVQHQHEAAYKQWKEKWDFLVSAIKGSTYYKLPRLFQWLSGNIGFHHIHHLSSSIPNYNLEQCARENPILQRYVTVLTFRESLKCIFHKLWDEDQQRMISFREYKRLARHGRAA